MKQTWNRGNSIIIITMYYIINSTLKNVSKEFAKLGFAGPFLFCNYFSNFTNFQASNKSLEYIPWPDEQALGWSPSQSKADKTCEPISHHLKFPIGSLGEVSCFSEQNSHTAYS